MNDYECRALWRRRLIACLRNESEDHCGTAAERAKVLLICRIEARTSTIASMRAACLRWAVSIDDRNPGSKCAMDSSWLAKRHSKQGSRLWSLTASRHMRVRGLALRINSSMT